jgi:hypothetical protein
LYNPPAPPQPPPQTPHQTDATPDYSLARTSPVTLVAAIDLDGAGFHGPSWLGWVNLPAGWLVPYLLGIAWARGSLRGHRTPP